MQELINGLLFFSRVTTQAKPFEAVDLDKVVHEVLSDLEIRIEQTKAQVNIGEMPVIAADPLQVRLTVEDNGIGFEEKYIDRIFGVFQRLHGKSEYEGTGIGLSICKKIAERHSGSITATNAPRPGLILLDLNMPKMDGREALKEIKEDPGLADIPVVVLTTSQAEEDIHRTYNLGVNSFISKPVTFAGLVEVMKVLDRYWFNIVKLPL